jgi:hypothetical protein
MVVAPARQQIVHSGRAAPYPTTVKLDNIAAGQSWPT